VACWASAEGVVAPHHVAVADDFPFPRCQVGDHHSEVLVCLELLDQGLPLGAMDVVVVAAHHVAVALILLPPRKKLDYLYSKAAAHPWILGHGFPLRNEQGVAVE